MGLQIWMRHSPCFQGADSLVEETGTKIKCLMWRQTPSTNFLPWAQNSTLAFCRSTVRALLGYGRVIFSHYLVSVAALSWFQSPTVVLYSWVCLTWRSWSGTGLNLKTDLLWLLIWGPFSKLSIHPCWLRLSYLDELRTKKERILPLFSSLPPHPVLLRGPSSPCSLEPVLSRSHPWIISDTSCSSPNPLVLWLAVWTDKELQPTLECAG